MRISRARIIVSGALGVVAALTAVGVAVLLGHQSDPALRQSSSLRSRFSPPPLAANPLRQLRVLPRAPRPVEVQLAAPASASPAVVAAAAPVAEPADAEPAGAEPVDDRDDGDGAAEVDD